MFVTKQVQTLGVRRYELDLYPNYFMTVWIHRY